MDWARRMLFEARLELGSWVAEVVFVGDATVALLVEDPSLRRIWTPFDVALVAEVLSTGPRSRVPSWPPAWAQTMQSAEEPPYGCSSGVQPAAARSRAGPEPPRRGTSVGCLAA
jgi:hypothetical protein